MDVISTYIIFACIILSVIVSGRENYKFFRKLNGGVWYKIKDTGKNPVTEIYSEVFYWSKIKPADEQQIIEIENYVR